MVEKPDDYPSRSEKKREHLALQALAASLVKLSRPELDLLPLDDGLRQVVVDGKSMTKAALRRQIRYLARLLSRTDYDGIRAAINDNERRRAVERARLHGVERWRERLLQDEGGALPELLAAYPDADRQKLRRLLRSARIERMDNLPPRAFRELFAFIRALSP